MKRILTLFVLAAFFIKPISAQEKKLFDDFIEKAMEAAPMVPSIGIAVVKDGKVAYLSAYGDADPEMGLKATPETAYYIASITKSFTGLLGQMLADEGVINLDAPLTTYKPFSKVKNRELFEELTIRHLLNHTSGLENGYIVFREAYTGDKSKEILTMLLEEKTEKGKVGEYEYSNLGYNLFALLLEAEFGWKWQDLLQEKIFGPLNMEHTSAYVSKSDREKWSMAWPYVGYRSNTPERSYLMKNDAMMQSAGGLLCSPKDAANWMMAFLNGGKLDGEQVIPKSQIEAVLKPSATYDREGDIFKDRGYGLGWVNAEFGGERINYHFGGYNGFFSHISIMPEKNIGIAVFANEPAFGDNVSNLIASYIYDYYLGNVDDVNDYDERIEALKKRITDVQTSINAHYEKINAREWQLELPKSEYAGTYENKYLGTVKIEEKNGDLHVTMGPLKTVATPFTDKNSIRIEFAGSGNVCSFNVKKNKVVNMNYDGDVFERVN
ncbi:MAG: serine hydrolase [Ekhidna sp.]|uniref:serine hydrolase n=1 Tax=Ekhidna sp. TaxID=2608089 RepID=UPI0032EBC4F8